MSKQVVFITDADSDSGKALIRRFAREGAGLLLNSASGGKELSNLPELSRTDGTKAHIVNIDLCKSSHISAMLDEAERELGAVTALVHNNRAIGPALVETCGEALFLDILNANAKSAFFCTQTVGRRMAARGGGSVVLVGSIHGEKPTGASFPYSASQGAVKMLAREAAIFLGRHGIRVNLIEMGPVEGSDVLFQSELSSLYDSYRYKVPSGELGTCDDLAELACFLCRDEAQYLNGADIRLDGGFLMHYMDSKVSPPPSPPPGDHSISASESRGTP
ncbi:SDR family NAD(P)-dependent oxidoreductase [Paenibacillus hamazuiensis]|uniref:SDR family NAD(P)-dependent oxidoreductase n=1 Tax=Paenibacillus hamazuiensis TaxID=2936508 RepID=UPI00200FD2D5|nr:SDR family oxidoreductase [Paenibacillus hamazuiensis]